MGMAASYGIIKNHEGYISALGIPLYNIKA